MPKLWHGPVYDVEHDITARTGLLAPSGEFFPCIFSGHAQLARENLSVPHGMYEYYNFIHVTAGLVSEPLDPPTQAQIDTLFDWCRLHNITLPSWATT